LADVDFRSHANAVHSYSSLWLWLISRFFPRLLLFGGKFRDSYLKLTARNSFAAPEKNACSRQSWLEAAGGVQNSSRWKAEGWDIFTWRYSDSLDSAHAYTQSVGHAQQFVRTPVIHRRTGQLPRTLPKLERFVGLNDLLLSTAAVGTSSWSRRGGFNVVLRKLPLAASVGSGVRPVSHNNNSCLFPFCLWLACNLSSACLKRWCVQNVRRLTALKK